MKQKKRRHDNSGMSLLEVIIAVSIFSIAAVILMQGFVTSGMINKKSNLYLEATSLAQNVMEEIKSKDFEDVALAFNYPLAGGVSQFSFLESQRANIANETTVIKEILKTTDGYTDARVYYDADGSDTSKITSSIISTDGGKTYEFNPHTEGTNVSRYYFEMENVTNLYETFDVLVEFDGSVYKKEEFSTADDELNDYLSPNISQLDTKSNAFLNLERDKDVEIMENIVEAQKTLAIQKWTQDREQCETDEEKAKFDEQYPMPEGIDMDDLYKYAERTMEIRLSKDATGVIKAEYKYTVSTAKYTGSNRYESMAYVCGCGGNPEAAHEISPGGDFCCTQTSEEFTAFYSSEAGTTLQNLYLFYNPNYASTMESNRLDKIIFNNEINQSVNLYIVKQRDRLTGTPTKEQEENYRMSLTVYERPRTLEKPQLNWNTNQSLFKAQTKLRTNLDYNIWDADNITGREATLRNQMSLAYVEKVYNADGNVERTVQVSGAGAKKILSYNGLDDREEEDRIYTATVSVYKAGAAQDGFPEKDLIVALDGAKNG